MLGVEIEFDNNWAPAETSNYKPTKAKTPARTQGFFDEYCSSPVNGVEPVFSVSDGGPGRNRPGAEDV